MSETKHTEANHEIEKLKEAVKTLGGFYASLYAHLAKEVIDTFGEKGEEAIREGTRKYGKWRGANLRKAHQEQGYEINLKNLFEHYDMPNTNMLKSHRFKTGEREWASEVFECTLYDMWERIGMVDMGLLYCEEFHHAMWQTYWDKIKLEMPKILTQPNDRCRFEVDATDE